MSVITMKRSKLSQPTTTAGALYQTEISVNDTEESDIYLLPFTRVYDIAIELEGDGTVQFSNSTIEKLEAGQGKFKAWDGLGKVNLALVAFKVVGVSGLVEAVISAKTDTV